MVGNRLLHYEILEKLGEGGMGVVYKARDTRLGRFVAIKVLPPAASANPDRQLRFLQEARTASALNHPNIVTVYEIAAIETVHFIAMEYIAGKTLQSVIGRRGLETIEILNYAIQIADALAKAHAAGIVHRDLKPGNIMVVEGQVKVLDFGLAKLLQPATLREEEAETDTQTAAAPVTHEGVVHGTAPYMSPEQVEGKPVDARSDIFSFGAILYEMATGRRAFTGNTGVSVISAILREEPKPVGEVAPRVPRDLEKIIGRCLRKDPSRRFQSILDVKLALEDIKQDFDTGTLTPRVPASRESKWSMLRTGVAGLATIAAALALGFWWSGRLRTPQSPTPLVRLTSDAGIADYPALSPDGKLLAYASDRAGGNNLDLWIKQVPGGEPLRLTRHESDEYDPSFSADGTRVAYRSEQDGGGIYVIPALGGEPRLLAKRGRSPRFSPDGTEILYRVTSSPDSFWSDIFVMSATGGAPRQIQPEFPIALTPIWAPDGKHVVFLGAEKHDAVNELFDWWVAPIEGGTPTRTGAARTFKGQELRGFPPGVWPAGDRIFFAWWSGGNSDIWEVSISPADWKIHSPARKLTSGTTDESSPSSSSEGHLAFTSAVWNTDLWAVPLDANSGKTLGGIERLTNDYAFDVLPSVSADGRKVVFLSDRGKPGNLDAWIKHISNGRETPLTFTGDLSFFGILSPDGSRVSYPRTENNKWNTYQIAAEGGTPQKICDDCGQPRGWSPDNRSIIGQKGPAPTQLVLLDPEKRTSRELLRHTSAGLYAAQFSPDGRWVAFGARFKPGDERLFLVPFRGGEVPKGEAEWIAVTSGPALDNKPRWSPDGNLLYFTSDRDEFTCVWAQRLDPATKRPRGSAFPVLHLHGPQRSFAKSGALTLEISIARDKLVFHLDEARGNIWMMEVQKD